MEFLEDRTTPTAWTTTDAFIPNRVIVSYADESASAPAGGFIESALPLGYGQFAVTISSNTSVAQATAFFASQPGVVASGPDYVIQIQRTPNDPSYSSLWGMNNTGQSGGIVDADIDAPEAWDLQTGTRATIVGVIDTGIDYNHPDLAANMWRNPGETPNDGIDNDGNGFVDDVFGYDFANNDGNPMDDEGHGTHVAGTIGAVGNNGIGVVGVNWNTRLMALKFLDANGSGSTSNAVRALNYAITMGAHITNNSWGGGGPDSNLATAIARARTSGQIFVAAAGNAGTNNNTTAFWPSNYSLTYDNVVSVASVDRNNNLSSFSNYGSTTVTLGAPGSSILSTTPNNTYSTFSGTSMASPHVAGALALLRDQNPTWTYTQLINKLKSSVDPLASLNGRTTTGGRLNVFRMLDNGTVPPPPPPPPPSDTTGARVTTAVFSGTATTNFNNVRVTFNEAINASTFTTADVTLTGPNGSAITPTSVTAVSGTTTQFNVSFASQTAAGTYTIVVGPAINDLAGNAMDQNGNNVNGENPGDRYTATGTIGGRFTYSAGGLPVNIPDLTTVSIPITINDNIRITDVDVGFSIVHTYDSDLVISLRAPNGTTRTLVNRRGGAGDNFTGTVLDDEAATAVTSAAAPFSGRFRPEQALTAFDGLSTKGTWTLVVRDAARSDTGRVTAFTLGFTGSPILRLALGSADVEQGESTVTNSKESGKWSDTVLQGIFVGNSTPPNNPTSTAMPSRLTNARRGTSVDVSRRAPTVTAERIAPAPTTTPSTNPDLLKRLG
jgi:subtilisin family serine protease